MTPARDMHAPPAARLRSRETVTCHVPKPQALHLLGGPACRRVLRCCCLCCCKHKPTGDPGRVLGGRGMLAHKALLLLLCAGVAACCGYGMARANPQWVDRALGVLDSLKARTLA